GLREQPVMFLELLELQRALRSEPSKLSLTLLELVSALCSELSKLSLTLLELASSLCRGLREQSVMFLEPRDVGRPEKSVSAQEGYLCYESSHKPVHFVIVPVRARFFAIKTKPKPPVEPKPLVKCVPRARDFFHKCAS